ncbi:MAG: hypothetical protein J4G10_01475 [Alphaproteobacteria bacterium]|nr:hypothetical protein [Alphaproteobacteria bacterium]
MSSSMKGLALIVIGVLVNNVSYLYDLIIDAHDGWIFLGWKTQAGAALGMVAIVIGLFLIWQESKKAA